MHTLQILGQILFIMYWIIIGLLVLFKIYTPPTKVMALAFIMTGVLIAILLFDSRPITKVHIYNY